MCIFEWNFDFGGWGGDYAPFELLKLAKMKYTTEPVCQRNSSVTAQQNFM